MEFEEKKVFLVNITFTAVVAFLIFLTARFMLVYLLPFVIGVVLAFLMQKPAAALSRKCRFSKSTLAAFLVSAAYLLLVVILIVTVWAVFRFIVGITDLLPQYFEDFQRVLSSLYQRFEQTFEQLPDTARDAVDGAISGAANSLSGIFADFLSSIATTTVRSLPAFLFSSIVTVLASFYIAKDFDRIVAFVRNMISQKRYTNIVKIKNILVDSVFKMMLGYTVLMGITFLELSAGFFVLGVKNALMVAAAVAVIDLLPVLGTGTVLIPWSIICFFASSTSRGIGFLVLYLFITVMRNVLEPKIIGKQTGIYPLLTLILIFVGLRISGIAGMILLPIIVTVVINYYKQQMEEESVQCGAKQQKFD